MSEHFHRQLPQAEEAEKGLLGSYVIAPNYTAEICERLGIGAGHFHLPAHARLYAVLEKCQSLGQKIDFIRITQELRDSGELELCGGAAGITGLYTYVPTHANAEYYAEQLVEKWILREGIRVTTEFARKAYEPLENAQGLLEALEVAVLGIRRPAGSEMQEISPKDGALAALEEIERLIQSKGQISGLSTGFPALDRMTNGLLPAQVYFIAARPSMGKTALAVNIAEHIGIHLDKPVLFISAEMPGNQIHLRLNYSISRVNGQAIRDGFLDDADFDKISAAAIKIANSKLHVIDAQDPTIGAVRATCRRLHRKHGLAAIFVDYAQYLRSLSRQAESSREREVAEISRGLKAMAKELNLPVIVLAQLNRDVEKRTGARRGRPQLSDLRESGAMEQDADLIAFLYREECYAETEEEKVAAEGKATLIVAKQRNGPLGDVPLRFLKEFTRFEPV